MTRMSVRAMTCTSVSFPFAGTSWATRIRAVFLLAAAALIALSSRPVRAQTWARTYGGSSGEIASSIVQTSDGGFAVAGYTASFGPNPDYPHAWVLKLNGAGAIEWQWAYSGIRSDFANSIVQTSDGGFAVAGYTNSNSGGGSSDFWVLRLNSAGGVQWQWTYGGGANEIATSIVQTSDGGFGVAGYTTSFGAGIYDFWVLKLNSAGTIQWQKTYGGSGNDLAYSIVQTADGGFAVAGYTSSYGAGDTDSWILKLNSLGTIQWQKTYGGVNSDAANSIVQTPDGGFAVAGYTASFGSGGVDAWALRLDSVGEVLWASSFGGSSNEWASSVWPTADGGCVVAGIRDPGDLLVMKLDSTGGNQWVKVYGAGGYDAATSIVQTSDGGFGVAGYTNSFGAGAADSWVLRLNSTGDIGGSCSLLSPGGGTQVIESTATVQTQCQE